MIRHLCALFALLGAIPLALAAPQGSLEKSLDLWKPVSISVANGRVTVVTRQRQVTDDIYQAMIAGVCNAEHRAPGALKGISEVAIVNVFSKQGYVFEGGSKECQEFNVMPGNKTKMWVLGRTHEL